MRLERGRPLVDDDRRDIDGVERRGQVSRQAVEPVCVVSAQDRLLPPRSVRMLKKPVSVAALIAAVEQHCGKPTTS